MCDYCENYKFFPMTCGDNVFYGQIVYDINEKCSVFCVNNVEDFDLDKGECKVSFSTKINYCPICGKSLEDYLNDGYKVNF